MSANKERQERERERGEEKRMELLRGAGGELASRGSWSEDQESNLTAN